MKVRKEEIATMQKGGMSAEINEAVKLEECKSGGESESVRRPTATGKKCPCLGCGKKN